MSKSPRRRPVAAADQTSPAAAPKTLRRSPFGDDGPVVPLFRLAPPCDGTSDRPFVGLLVLLDVLEEAFTAAVSGYNPLPHTIKIVDDASRFPFEFRRQLTEWLKLCRASAEKSGLRLEMFVPQLRQVRSAVEEVLVIPDWKSLPEGKRRLLEEVRRSVSSVAQLAEDVVERNRLGSALVPAPVQPVLSERIDPVGGDTSETANAWPPDNKWHFRPGEFAFMGVVGTLTGKPWELLKTLAKSRRAMKRNEIRDDVWGDGKGPVRDTDCTDENIRNTLKAVRESLRLTFHLAKGKNPLCAIDKGELAAWKVNEGMLREKLSQ